MPMQCDCLTEHNASQAMIVTICARVHPASLGFVGEVTRHLGSMRDLP